MFQKQIYIDRRNNLRKQMNSGVLLFLGNQDVAFNYPANIYPFRQDSAFLYFFGIDQPMMAAVIDLESGEDIIFGDELEIDDIIWMGKLPTIKYLSEKVGINKVLPSADLKKALEGKKVHFLPPYRGETKHQLESLLGIKYDSVREKASVELIEAVVKLRSIKDEFEIAEIEKMVNVAYDMHTTAMAMAKVGVKEQQIAGAIQGVTLYNEGPVSFSWIVTIKGQTLQKNYYG